MYHGPKREHSGNNDKIHDARRLDAALEEPMKAVYDEAAQLARDDKDFVIATVVHTQGSTPQKPGAALLVRHDGSTVGTLGGGCVEGDIWFAAKEALRERTGPVYKRYYLNEDIAARDGLVCGGTMFFYIEPVIDAAHYSNLSAAISDAYAGGPSLSTATLVSSDRLEIGARIVVQANGESQGSLGDAALDAEAVETAKSVMSMGKTARIRTDGGDDVFVEGYTAPALLVLIGGGHVNLQVARLAQVLGFRVMVTDDRREFANQDRFPMAEAVNVESYDKGINAFPVTPNTAIVVGTRGHHFDDLATEAAALTTAGYVGLLGSKRKTIMIYERLLQRGLPEKRLRAIRSPIGLDLGGRTPEEIALSIMSEIVAWRHDREGGPMTIESSQIDRIADKVKAAAPAGQPNL